MFKKFSVIAAVVFALHLCSTAQEFKPAGSGNDTAAVPSSTAKPGSQIAPQNKPAEKAPVVTNEKIPSGAKLYVAPIANGFETYIIAGLQKKEVPVVVVIDHEKADFELSGISQSDQAGWAKMLFLGSQQTNESASIKVVNLQTGNVVFAYSVNKTNSVRGKQSAGESVAKHLKEKIESQSR